MMEPLQSQNKQLDETNIGESLKLFQLQLAQTATTVAQEFLQFHQGILNTVARIQPMVDTIAKIKQNIEPFFVKLSHALEQLPGRTRSILATLAQHGWYIDPDMNLPEIADMVMLFEQGEVTKANNELVLYFDQRKDAILSELCTAFPKRANIFTSAFEAHADGKYDLSIPVLLTQADGICLELTGAQLYSKQRDRKVTRVAEVVATFDVDSFTAALLYPLTEVFPIAFSSEERVGLPDILNRHAILHGESITYGTHINSCKAISLVSFTAWVLSSINKPSYKSAVETH